MKTHAVAPDAHCCRCGYGTPAATGVAHGNCPKPGDFTMCARCGLIMRLTATLECAPATPAEIETELSPGQRAMLAELQRSLPNLKLWAKDTPS